MGFSSPPLSVIRCQLIGVTRRKTSLSCAQYHQEGGGGVAAVNYQGPCLKEGPQKVLLMQKT